jgi:hypothetical protein
LSEREPNVKKEEDTSLNEIKEEKETSTEKESSTAKSSGSKMQKDFTNHLRKRLREKWPLTSKPVRCLQEEDSDYITKIKS